MFKNNEPPVSLFSFQDIITTLTGIMIFFLLILVISMLEITENSEQETAEPVYTEWREVAKQNDLLREQIDGIAADTEKYQRRLRKLSTQDEGALILEKDRLQEQLRQQQLQLKDARRKLEQLEHQLKFEIERQQRVEAGEKQLKQQQQRLRSAERDLKKLRARVKELEKEIAERRKVNITLDRQIAATPLVIECARDVVKVVDPATNTTREFRRRTPAATDMISEVIKYLKTLPVSKYYFVFLIKPSAANYLEFITNKLNSKAIPGAKYGIEPVLENEECI